MYLQDVDHYRKLRWNDTTNFGELRKEEERQFSIYNFEAANIDMLWELFKLYEAEAEALLEKELQLPAYDYVLKCSHTFNLLDARGAVSITERPAMIGRIRNLAAKVARVHVAQREALGFPLLNKDA